MKYGRSIIAIYITILSYLAFKQYTIAFAGFLMLLFVFLLSFLLSFVFRVIFPRLPLATTGWVAKGRRGEHPHRRRADGDGEVNTLSPAGQVIAPLLYKGARETNSSFFPPTLHHLRPSQTSTFHNLKAPSPSTLTHQSYHSQANLQEQIFFTNKQIKPEAMAVPAETVGLVVTFVVIAAIVMLVFGICFIRGEVCVTALFP